MRTWRFAAFRIAARIMSCIRYSSVSNGMPDRWCYDSVVAVARTAGIERKKRQSTRRSEAMYKGFFGLKDNPFNVNPDPRYLFLTKQVEEVLSGLMYGIQTRKGIITLTGEVGTGKTTLVNRLLEWLHGHGTKTAFLFNSRMNSTQLFDFVLAEFEIPCDSRPKSQQLMKLNQWLLDRCRPGETAVLIVDEAQSLTYPVLEEIRLLTN